MPPIDDKNAKALYEVASQHYDVGSYDDFKGRIQDPANRKSLYDTMSKDYDLGDYNSFNQHLGFDSSQPAPPKAQQPQGTVQQQPPKVTANDAALAAMFPAQKAVSDATHTPQASVARFVKPVAYDKPEDSPMAKIAIDKQVQRNIKKNYPDYKGAIPQDIVAREKANVVADLNKGDLAVGRDASGKIDMQQGSGSGILAPFKDFFHNFNEAVNQSYYKQKEDNFLLNGDRKDVIAHLNAKLANPDEVAKNWNLSKAYAPSGIAGEIGQALGENASLIARNIEGHLAGAALAPETMGASEAGAFAATANDLMTSGGGQALERNYMLLKQQHPDLSDDQAYDKAHTAALAGAASNLAVGAVLSGNIATAELPKPTVAAEGVFNGVREAIRSSPKVLGTAAAGSLLNDATSNAIGAKVDGKEMMDNVKEAVKGMSAMHFGIPIAMGLPEAIAKVPSYLRPQFENVVASAPREQVLQAAKTAEDNGKVPEGSTQQLAKKLDNFDIAKESIPAAVPLNEQTKAAIAGKTLQKAKLKQQIDELSQHGDAYKDHIEGLQKQVADIDATINNMARDNNPFLHERDNLTGERLYPVKTFDELSSKEKQGIQVPKEYGKAAVEESGEGENKTYKPVAAYTEQKGGLSISHNIEAGDKTFSDKAKAQEAADAALAQHYYENGMYDGLKPLVIPEAPKVKGEPENITKPIELSTEITKHEEAQSAADHSANTPGDQRVAPEEKSGTDAVVNQEVQPTEENKVNEPTDTGVTSPTESPLPTADALPKGQVPAHGVLWKNGVQDRPAPTGQPATDAAAPVLEEAKPVEYTTQSGKYKVTHEGVIDTKTGKEPSRSTVKKAISEAADNYDFTAGKPSPEEPDVEINSADDHTAYRIDKTTKPSELADIYINEQPVPVPLSTKETFIAEYGIGKVKTSSFDEYSDRNNRNVGIARSYLDNTKGRPLDSIAEEISGHHGIEITPQDIADFMVRFPNGVADALKTSESGLASKAKAKFKSLTGFDLNNEMAEKAIDQEFKKLSDEQQRIAEQDFATKQQLEEEYWRTYHESDHAAKESTDPETKQAATADQPAANTGQPPEAEAPAPPADQTGAAAAPAGKYETKARKIAEKIKAGNLPDWLKADYDINYQQLSSQAKEQFVKATDQQITEVKTAFKNGGVHGLLRHIMDTSRDSHLRAVASVLLRNIHKADFLDFRFDLARDRNGYPADANASYAGGKLNVNEKVFWMPTNMFHKNGLDSGYKTIIHELMHVFTLQAYRKPKNAIDKEFKQFVDDAYRELKANSAFKSLYGFQSPEEFISEIISNPEFRNLAPAYKPGLVAKFVNWVAKILGYSKDVKGEETNRVQLVENSVKYILDTLPRLTPSKGQKVFYEQEGKGGISAEEVKQALSDAVITTGKLLDKGVALKEAIKEAVKDLVHMQGKENEEKILNGFEQYYRQHFSPDERTIEAPAGERGDGGSSDTSIKNAVTLNERQQRGLDEVQLQAKRTFGDVFDKGKELVDNGTIDPRILAQTLADKPRPLTPEESVALLYDRMRLQNEHAQVHQLIKDATDRGGDDSAQPVLASRLAAIEDAIHTNDEASRRTGYEQGLGLAIRRLMIRQDYSLANQLQQFRNANNGKEVPAEVKAKLETLTVRLEEATKKLDEYEKQQAESAAKKALEETKKAAKKTAASSSGGRQRKTKEDYVKEREDIRRNISDKLRQSRGQANSVVTAVVDFAKIAPDVAKLLASYVEENANIVLGEVRTLLKKDLEDSLGEAVSDEDVRKLIAGEYKGKKATRSQLSQQVADLRQEEQLLREYEALQRGEEPKTPQQKAARNARLEALRNKISELKGIKADQERAEDRIKSLEEELQRLKDRREKEPEEKTSRVISDREQQVREAIEAEKKAWATEKNIDKLQTELERVRKRQPKVTEPKEKKELSDTEQDLVAQIKAEKEKWNAELEPARRLAQAEKTAAKSVAELEEKLAANDLEIKQATKLSSPRLDALREQQKDLRKQLEQKRKEAEVGRYSYDARIAAYKEKLRQQQSRLQQQLDNRDFEEKPKAPLALDDEARRLQANVEKIKEAIDHEKFKLKQANRNKLEKGLDWFNAFTRANLLSSVTTTGKLGNAAVLRQFTNAIEEVIGAGLRKVPGLSSLAKDAPRHGAGLNVQAEAKSLAQWWSKATYVDFLNTLRTGKSELDYLYGKKKQYPEAGFLKYVGHLHSALKVPAKRAEFQRAFALRAAHEMAHGGVMDAPTQARISLQAYLDANRAIFMQDNIITKNYQTAVTGLEHTGAKGKVGAATLRFLLPVVKVPSNYVAETTSYAAGGLKAAVSLVYHGLNKGLSNMTSEEKDYVMRALRKQGLGMGLLALGYLNPQAVGGYYTGQRKAGDLDSGDLTLFGIKLPHWLLHAPALEVLQMGATYRRVQDDYGAKEKSGGNLAALGETTKGVAEEVPFLNTGISQAMENAKGFTGFMGNMIASRVISPDLGKIARAQDVDESGDPIKRSPQTITDYGKQMIPGLRGQVPENAIRTIPKSDQQKKGWKFLADKGVDLPRQNKNVVSITDADGNKRKMTDQEFDTYFKKRSDYIEGALREAVDNNDPYSGTDANGKRFDEVPVRSMTAAQLVWLRQHLEDEATRSVKGDMFGGQQDDQ